MKHAAFNRMLSALRKVPIVVFDPGADPLGGRVWVCKGCYAGSDEECAEDCWAREVEAAINAAEGRACVS